MARTEETTDATVAEVAEKAVKDGGVATFKQLLKKPKRTLTFTVFTADEDGEEVALKVKYRALSSKAYDALLAEHPPTTKEKREGATYNVDTFTPALISAVSLEPKITLAEATELYESDDWSGGEVATLFVQALRVCNASLDVPFNARD